MNKIEELVGTDFFENKEYECKLQLESSEEYPLGCVIIPRMK